MGEPSRGGIEQPLRAVLAGSGCEEVLARIKSRAKGGEGDISPGRKLGLIVEGGAMRGCYTGGILVALQLAGATNAFDAAYATSAGVVNCAHFLSGEGHRKAGTYYQALAGSEFINPLRLWKVADVDYVINEVLRRKIPLEMESLLANPTPFYAALLNYDSALPELKHVQGKIGDPWDIIKASIAMPVLYNRTIPIQGNRYFDCGLAVPFPLREAIEDGCDDLLVVLSRDPGIEVSSGGAGRRLLYSTLFAKGRRDLIAVYDGWSATLSELQGIALGIQEVGRPGVRIATIYPYPQLIGSSTRNRALLRDATLQMTRETLRLLDVSDEGLDRVIRSGVL